MATKTKLINGLSFEVAQPYEAGQTINEAEAKTLNQVRSENIGNNLRNQIKTAQEEGKSEADIAKIVAEYDASYVFTLASVSASAKYTPEERAARSMAREVVKAKLAETGKKLNVVPEGLTKEEWDAKIEAAVEKVAGSEVVIKAAKKAVAEKANRTSALASELDL